MFIADRMNTILGEGHRCQLVFAYSVLSVISVQSFCGKDEGFLVKTKDFWWRWRIFYFFFIFAKNPSSLPHCLQWLHCILMGGHLHWACADILMRESPLLQWACLDIIMRGNPLTDMTENTEDTNTNWQCLHTSIVVILSVGSYFCKLQILILWLLEIRNSPKIFIVRKRSCGKVMFLHLSVILFTEGGGVCLWVHAVYSHLEDIPGQTDPLADTPPPEADTPIGRHSPSQTHTFRGRHPPRADIPPGKHPDTATAADGTHPTGMHSCYKIFMLIALCARAFTLEIVFFEPGYKWLSCHPNTSACNNNN